MQRKHYALATLITAATCAVLAFTAATQLQAQDKAADPTGTWTWTRPGRNGGPDVVSTLKLKADADKLTGTLSSPGRGGQAQEAKIDDGKVKGDQVSFSVTREFNGNKMTAKYNGKLSGDTIKGTIETERNGETQSRPWEAKRSTEKK
jgi:hypothetical protein